MKYGIVLGYVSKLNFKETLKAIELIKDSLFFDVRSKFKLIAVDSTIVTDKKEWLNDDFQQTKRPIDFDITEFKDFGEIMLSNNKWRRKIISKIEHLELKKGIISKFTTIDRDTKASNTSSVIYEELGIEIVSKEIDMKFLDKTLIDIYTLIYNVDKKVSSEFKILKTSHFSKTLTFVTYTKLRELYPLLTFKERINKFAKENGSFVLKDYVEKIINHKSMNNFSEDVFNFKTYSKLYVYNHECEKAMSLGYASYQVDREVLRTQNLLLKENYKNNTNYNFLIKANKLPITLSAGIFVNRVTMTITEKQHIAEVHSSIWSNEFIEYCNSNKIKIL
ncbi:hypothetical protein [Spiroplasma turonicum]|uniref:Asparagine synthetase AsnA n=1 Tax=Spiroplasma turonicum TaxID=216946 RepID=A0A0K1P525_9MOLU|nr:hypothetical protein [Spiroplasma turonicum]AKU79264.1 asparagine synthetase AsnA [Spiroplasma turonicum]ALX70287.1 asparagine synthetase AsnA [Spiroplasma turonicum]